MASLPVADPGFSPGGGGGAPTPQKCYYFSIFCRKLHENERIWTPRGGGARPWRPLLDPPMLTEPQMETLHQVLAFHFATHLPKKLQIGRTITLVNTNKFFSENCVSLCPIDITHSVILFNINQNL